MIKVSIIILNWNRFDDTKECLESLDKLKLKDNIQVNVLIVDNGSADDSIAKLKKLSFKNINPDYLLNGANLGFAAGNNRGMEKAIKEGADYLVVLNNDTIVHEELITSVISNMESNNVVVAAAPKIYFAKGFEFKDKYKQSDLGKVIWYAGGEIDWNNVYGTARGVDEVDEGQFNSSVETDFATGACLFLKTTALKEVGLFNEKYFMYYEDTDLSQRLKLAGKKIVYDPSGVIWHKVAQSSGIGSNLNDYFTTRNRMLFGMKYASFRTKIALLRESVRLLISGRKYQKQGIKDFYLGRFGKGSWK
ncbi:MAG: glycosyltransferase family 2 protein [Patescibacteria group bacterium]